MITLLTNLIAPAATKTDVLEGNTPLTILIPLQYRTQTQMASRPARYCSRSSRR